MEAGDRVPADARILETVSLEVDESALTGESVPVTKSTENLPPSTALAERRNMVFQGTVVTRGRGVAVVVATGSATEMGGIADLISSEGNESTPLQQRLEHMGRVLLVVCLAISGFVGLAGFLRGEDPYNMLLTAVSLAVAAIPEGLPAVVTIVLALGVQKMLRKNAVIRRLPAVETLGCATVICSDKTGTLTRNEMTVRAIWSAGRDYQVEGEGLKRGGHITCQDQRVRVKDVPDPSGFCPLEATLLTATLCNNAQLEAKGDSWRVNGDPTEGALLVAAARGGVDINAVTRKWERVAEIPFESERRMMTVDCQAGTVRAVFSKGAPENLLQVCTAWLDEGGNIKYLSELEKKRILKVNETLAGKGMRVLATGFRIFNGQSGNPGELERDLVFTGLMGIIDPPREEVPRAVKTCQNAGIKVVMITGDHALTASAVARETGILSEGKSVVTGEDLESIDDDRLEQGVEGIPVYARVSPAHKLRIVRALKKRGHVVAMTGDGVNDAPALKAADIGVAMGISGTEVSKEASAMVLADDNFATIVSAVSEGRGIYENIRKFARYLLGCNAGEILVMLVATLAGLPLPLLPIHILLVNLVTDGLPAIALGVDPPDPDLMSRPPRNPKEGVFSRGLWKKIINRGTIIGLSTLVAFLESLNQTQDIERARSVALAVLSLAQLLYAFECRSEEKGPFEAGITRNRALLWAVGTSFAALVATLHLPILQVLLHTVPLSMSDWGLAVAAACIGPVWSGLARFIRSDAARAVRPDQRD